MLTYFMIICLLVFLDQLTKHLIVIHLEEGKYKVIIPRFFKITSVRNQGAAMGILSGQRVLFTIIPTLAILVLSYILYLEGNFFKNPIFTVSIILLISGALGNLLCRLFRKEVVDFLIFSLFGYDSPVFNLADLFIGFGMLGFVFREII